MKKINVFQLILLLFKGTLVGFGAILPGVSGGTLCVAFGMYKPLLNLLSHPIKTIKADGLRLLSFLIGVGIGFVGLAGLAAWLMKINTMVVTCVFVGFIIGTIPDLWHSAGEQGRRVSSYVSIFVGFAFLMSVLLLFRFSNNITIEPNIWSFFFCGIMWGLSFIVPGLSSSTLLLFFGLYEPMMDGISKLSFTVLIPLAIGMGLCLVALSKAVNAAFKKWYTQLSHAIIGIVVASTIMIVPKDALSSTTNILITIACVIGGFAVSFFAGMICNKLVPDDGMTR